MNFTQNSRHLVVVENFERLFHSRTEICEHCRDLDWFSW